MTRIEVSLTHVLFFKPLVIYRLGGEGGGGPRDFRGGISQGSVRREDYGKLTVNKNRGTSLEYYRVLGGGGNATHAKEKTQFCYFRQQPSLRPANEMQYHSERPIVTSVKRTSSKKWKSRTALVTRLSIPESEILEEAWMFNSESDQHQISPHMVTSKSNNTVMRIKVMITNWRSSWLLNKFSLWAP